VRQIALTSLIALCALLLLVACGHTPSSERTGVVTMAPHLTETVFALGKGGEVVARGKFCDYPPEVLGLPDVGGYIDPNRERIALLRPRLVLLPGKHPIMAEFAAQQGIDVLNVHMDSLSSISEGFLQIGVALDCEDAATALARNFIDEIAALCARVGERPPVRVLIITSRTTHDLDALHTVGSDSFLHEMVAAAGGENIYADTSTPYFEASKETVVLRAPEAIVEFHAGERLGPEDEDSFRADWEALATVPAVRDARIYLLTEAHATRPGPRVPEIARRIATLLHPEIE
jgi:iron complex transport system substrate-binding protein